jgi:alkylation response protein AidB-like acyl-CoA dehydrogenase
VIFAFTEEQEQLHAAVRRFLTEKSPESEVRRLMETVPGYDAGVWRQAARQLGLTGLAIPEKFGGSGSGYVELTVVFEEMGRALLCAPFFATVALAANLLLSIDDEIAKADYLPGLASGDVIATVALAEPSGRWDEAGVSLAATGSAGGWTLTGEKLYVLDGAVAGLFLVVARTPAGVSVFAVESGAPGLTVQPLATVDQTRKQARVLLDATPARLLGAEGAGWPAVSRMLDLAAVALAAEQVGGAQRVLDMAVDYAKTRVQFGKPIGSFQAIKHKCRHVPRGGVGPVGGLLRRLRGRGRRRAADRGEPGQGVLLRGLPARGRGEHPDPRRHRLHLGTSGPPVLQAGEEQRTALR